MIERINTFSIENVYKETIFFYIRKNALFLKWAGNLRFPCDPSLKAAHLWK